MAVEDYANAFETTLSAGYTSGSGSASLTSVAGLPATGRIFRLGVFDATAGTLKVILKCTSYTGTTLTVTAEGTDASASSGDKVRLVLTGGAMDQIRADLVQIGTDASLPSTTGQKTGNLYFDNDRPQIYRFGASSFLALPIANVYVASSSASGTTYTAAATPTLTALYTGMLVYWKPDINNTGAVTLNIDSLGAKSVKRNDGSTALVADDLIGGGLYVLLYDGTNFQRIAGPDGPWTGVSFSNGWSNTGSGFQTMQYRKHFNGDVHLRGIIAAGTKTSGTTFFTLPSGYRPAAAIRLYCLQTPGGVNTVLQLAITTAGVCSNDVAVAAGDNNVVIAEQVLSIL